MSFELSANESHYVSLTKPLIPLASPDASFDLVGGKALNLSILAVAGFPIPNAFFIPTASYNDFVSKNNLTVKIKEILYRIDTTSLEDLEKASEDIRSEFLKGTITAGFNTALENGWQ